MSVRIGSLCLMLVLVTAWTDDLQAGTFVIASPTGTPSFGQEIYPLAIRTRADLYQAIADSWLRSRNLDMTDPVLSAQRPLLTRFHEERSPLSSQSPSCYVFMSLQR